MDTEAFTLTIKDCQHTFCCPGCQAVADVIYSGGLDKFYQYRSELNRRPEQYSDNFVLYDREDIQQDFVEVHENNERTAHLLLDDMTCAACVWLIEKRLSIVDGVKHIRINAATHQCLLRWDSKSIALSQLMKILSSIGYRPQPLINDQQEQQRRRQQRLALMRLSVAAFGMMQVGMVAIALYAGALQGMDEQWVKLLRWVSLLVATPVVLFSAQPFWSAAWRSIKQRHLTMEVPVSLAIILAYLASAVATIYGGGEVYFDSVSMFTFFLLLGRYLEMRARYRNHQQTNHFTRLLPIAVQKTAPDDFSQLELVPLNQLMVDDYLRVNTGDTIPCDGVVIEGNSAVVEALLTGEVEPVVKRIGDTVIAGTVNTDGSLLIQATAVNQQTRLSTIEKLVSFAQQDKPTVQLIADKVASYFVAAVLCIATAVFLYWLNHQPESALWITLSVLVVTCPCALSLATPTVLAATVATMRRAGLLILKGHVIESLTTINRVVMDKTGTLTYGEPKVEQVKLIEQHITEDTVLAIAAALEEGSSHPIAKAFAGYRGRYQERYNVEHRQIVTGSGIKASIHQQEYALGKPEFVTSQSMTLPSVGQWLLLSKNTQPIAWILLSDQLRQSAMAAVHSLEQQNIHVEILSGDHQQVVGPMAQYLGGLDYCAGVSPEQKLEYIRQRQKQDPVLMVGDGINDVPVLAGANVSVAMDSASDFARMHADTVLLSNDLTVLAKAINIAHRCKTIIWQNITWALLYNLIALPLAAMGLIPPYLAAIGMSLSSLIVVLNALRI
ncbi:hypothetical protein AB835_04945 [Candidatus Endobugula sertula]|uniref:HMA domain-containing protein n=1 Tax=Candidatus Endobugula sertula TaxID=62101 RepID=A0A1D2QRN3_9GAMM|nr:hypothetical protein AB835_04945 [Candidatus Endobugula sertula]